MDDLEYKSLILYYGREKFYHLMQNTALEALSKFAGNACFRLYNGFALVLGNRIQEGIRELNPLVIEKDFAMSAILGLIFAHKRCTVVDKEALVSFDGRLKEERKKLTSNSAYFASVFLLLSGKHEKAKEYAERALKLNGSSTEALVMKGWAELCISQKMHTEILELFDSALTRGKNIDANLGQMRYHQLNNDFEAAISVLNRLSVRYPELNIPLVEKMKTQLASWNWDHALETALRILNLEPTNIEALRVKAVILICRDGKYQDGLACLNTLYSAVSKVEPSNGDLYLHIGQLFSRVCGHRREIIEFTFKFVEKAAHMSPGNADYITELGYHSILLGHYKEATKYFRSATKLDDSSIYALCGLTMCQLAESGPTEQVNQQIEFLNEIQGSVKTPLLLYMTAKLVKNNSDKAISYLVQACEHQFKNLKTLSYGTEYLRRFDPEFLLQVTKELIQHSPIQPTVASNATVSKETLHLSIKHSLNILEVIVKACPGLVQAVYQLAKVEFLCGEIAASAATLQKILQDLDPTYTDAHLLIAQIHIQQHQFPRAAQSLEICLSHNFNVRDNPMYHLLNGIIKKSQHQYEEALKCYVTTMNLSGLETVSSSSPSKTKNSGKEIKHLSLSDKATLYLEMVDVYMVTNQSTEAVKTMQIALEEFSETPEEGRLLIANADLALGKNDLAKAIEMLKNIHPGQTYYLQAKTKLANIFLHHKKDRLAFAQCFKELVDNCPGPESYLMLGEAYMSIQEPDEAISAFKKALKLNPTDALLASKLGRAYVKTHQYVKAINYYNEAVLNADHSSLKLDLSELYLKLKQYTNAEQTLISEIETLSGENEDIAALQTRTKQLLLLARIRERSGHLNSSLCTLKEASENQIRIQRRMTLEQSGSIQEQNKMLSKIFVLMAEQAIALRDQRNAMEHYKAALKVVPDDPNVMIALARLYLQANEVEECQKLCSEILKRDETHEGASVMMADLSFLQMDFESASFHFSQLLITQPTYWTALARFIEVMRRSGTILEALSFLQRAEDATTRNLHEPGLFYCQGLYEWYTGNPNGALKIFNCARRDPEWGQQAVFNMIEICINPDGELPADSSTDMLDDPDFRESRSIALKTAEQLLSELRIRPGGLDNESLHQRLLKSFVDMAYRSKNLVERALYSFTKIASQDEYKEHPGLILGIATAHILLKQSQRARNLLKRVAKHPWSFENAEYLEKCWLLLGDLYIQSNKTEIAVDLLNKVRDHNKSCCKSYELLAMIAEKDQNYRTAALNYDVAWRLSGKSKPAIGYKLAYNQMKRKRYADAIDVCQQVLKIHPDYPSIKKDILDKCRSNLRS